MPALLWAQEVKEMNGRNGNENHCNFKPKGRRGKNNNSSIPQRGAGPAGQARAMSDRYITDRFLPDKAIDLVDEACAMIKTEMDMSATLEGAGLRPILVVC